MLKEATIEDKTTFAVALTKDPSGMKYVAFYTDVEAWEKRDADKNSTYTFYTGDNENQVAGFIATQRLSNSGDLVLEYYISPEHRGNQYGKKVLKELISRLRSLGRARMLFAYVDPENKASAKALDGAGFLFQGRSGDWELYSYMVQ